MFLNQIRENVAAVWSAHGHSSDRLVVSNQEGKWHYQPSGYNLSEFYMLVVHIQSAFSTMPRRWLILCVNYDTQSFGQTSQDVTVVVFGDGILGHLSQASLVEQWQRFCLQCRSHRRCGVNPWVGKSSRGGYGNPLQYSCLENPRTEEPVGYSL